MMSFAQLLSILRSSSPCSSSHHLGSRVRDGHQQRALTICGCVSIAVRLWRGTVEPPNTVSAPSTVTWLRRRARRRVSSVRPPGRWAAHPESLGAPRLAALQPHGGHLVMRRRRIPGGLRRSCRCIRPPFGLDAIAPGGGRRSPPAARCSRHATHPAPPGTPLAGDLVRSPPTPCPAIGSPDGTVPSPGRSSAPCGGLRLVFAYCPAMSRPVPPRVRAGAMAVASGWSRDLGVGADPTAPRRKHSPAFLSKPGGRRITQLSAFVYQPVLTTTMSPGRMSG